MTPRINRSVPVQVVIIAAAFLTLVACGADDTDAVDAVSDPFGQQLTVSAGDAARLLAYVNDPTTDVRALDDTVGLNRLAATHIVDARNGKDGRAGTADDRFFRSLEELDAVKYVGPIALQRLLDYLAATATDSVLVEGVEFTATATAAVVWGCSRASRAELETNVGVDPRAAANLSLNAPYASITEIAAVYWVGAATLTLLRDYAEVWQAQMAQPDLAGTFDGIEFDHRVAAIALDIANTASREQLITDAGIYSTGATRIVAGRPYASLKALADTYGIGTATLQSLHDYAASGTWGNDTCAATLTDSAPAPVAAYASGIWSFDPSDDYAKFNLGAFITPTCNDIDDPEFVAALQTLLIDHAAWTSRYAEFSGSFAIGAVIAGPGRFLAQLDRSLDFMADHRDDQLRNGDTTASATYDHLADLHAQVSALANADPAATYSLSIHLDASECSEDASLSVNLASGQVLALHKGPGC